MIALGGCGGSGVCRSRKSPKKDAGCEEMGRKIEEKIKRELKDWASR